MTWKVTGVTRNNAGAVLGSQECFLFKYNSSTSLFTQIATQISNATTGAYAFTGLTDNLSAYCVATFKNGSPNVFDITDRNLTPVVEAGGGGAVVAADLFGEVMFNGDVQTLFTSSAFTNTGNAIVLAWVHVNSAPVTSDVKWGGVSMTRLGTILGGGAPITLWGLVGAATGSHTFDIADVGAGATHAYAYAMSFSGVNATLASAFTSVQSGSTTGTSIPTSAPVVSTTNSFIFGAGASQAGNSTPALNLANALFVSAHGFYLDSATSYEAGSASKTVTLTADVSDTMNVIAVSVNP